MELRHLRYFVAVAERLNYRSAAEALHVSQPALSTQIKDLEHDTGVQLLERNTGGVRLTDAGAVFLAAARRVLAQAEAAVGAARDAATGRQGRLAIGNFGSIAATILPASVRAFRRQYPAVEVTLLELSGPEQIEALATGEIHVGFVVADQAHLTEDLRRLTVLRSPLRAVLARGHRLAKARQVALGELETETLLAVGDRRRPTPHAETLRAIFRARGRLVPPVTEVGGLDSILATVASGGGVTLLPAAVGESRTAAVVFKRLRETGADLFTEVWALWRDRDTAPLARNFIAVLGRTRVPA